MKQWVFLTLVVLTVGSLFISSNKNEKEKVRVAFNKWKRVTSLTQLTINEAFILQQLFRNKNRIHQVLQEWGALSPPRPLLSLPCKIEDPRRIIDARSPPEVLLHERYRGLQGGGRSLSLCWRRLATT